MAPFLEAKKMQAKETIFSASEPVSGRISRVQGTIKPNIKIFFLKKKKKPPEIGDDERKIK